MLGDDLEPRCIRHQRCVDLETSNDDAVGAPGPFTLFRDRQFRAYVDVEPCLQQIDADRVDSIGDDDQRHKRTLKVEYRGCDGFYRTMIRSNCDVKANARIG
jgi:hypothetical protein